jgi:hypothetical protein
MPALGATYNRLVMHDTRWARAPHDKSRLQRDPCDLLFLISRRVKYMFCPGGVRTFGMRQVTAAQILDHVPWSPAESSQRPAQSMVITVISGLQVGN